jgi:uncharacterized protein
MSCCPHVGIDQDRFTTLRSSLRAILIVGLMATALVRATAAEPLQDAAAAYRRGDYAAAMRLLRPQANQADAFAQYDLGVMYANGLGVPQDFAEAVKWYRLAADQGDAFAQTNLGLMYNTGEGVPQDYGEAVKWYRLAADQGDASAQTDLAFMYAEGQGVPQDLVQAQEWFTLAATRFPATENGARDIAVKNRDALAAKMTPVQVAEAAKLAREWKPK